MIFDCIAYFEQQKRDEINAYSKTNAIGWTMFANMFSGKNSAKMHWADILPFKVPGVETDEQVMPKSTKKLLIKLMQRNAIPRWAKDLAINLPSISGEVRE